MNRFNLKTEFPLDGEQDSVRSQGAHGQAATSQAAGTGSGQRAARRRGETPRLRIRTDDGFHLFRVY